MTQTNLDRRSGSPKELWGVHDGFQNVVAGVAGCCMTEEAHLDIGYERTPQRQPMIGGHPRPSRLVRSR